MSENKLKVSSSPHIRSKMTSGNIMLMVTIALLPSAIFGVWNFGLSALIMLISTVVAAVLTEYIYEKLMHKKVTVGDFSAVVTGLLLGLNMPPTAPWWMGALGSVFGILVVKQLFGGLGFNFANPALLGRIVLFIGFAGRMTAYAFPQTDIDALASATPLVAGNSMAGKDMLLQLLLGAHGGVLGETCAVALILGGIYLIATKTISAAIPLSYIGTVAVLSLVLGQDVVLQLFSGGLLLGAFFMATDYVTSPFTFTGRIVYGVCLGVITCIIRFYGNMAEGVSFALLLMNLLVPYINDLTRQKPLGGAKAK